MVVIFFNIWYYTTTEITILIMVEKHLYTFCIQVFFIDSAFFIKYAFPLSSFSYNMGTISPSSASIYITSQV